MFRVCNLIFAGQIPNVYWIYSLLPVRTSVKHRRRRSQGTWRPASFASFRKPSPGLPAGHVKGLPRWHCRLCWLDSIPSHGRFMAARFFFTMVYQFQWWYWLPWYCGWLRTPAPVDRCFIPLFIGFQPSKVVQDFATIHITTIEVLLPGNFMMGNVPVYVFPLWE